MRFFLLFAVVIGFACGAAVPKAPKHETVQRFPAPRSSRNLQDDLNDFLALIPVDEIVNIVLNYVANDAEVQAALQYLMSDEFESIVVYVDQQPELYDLLNFLESSGLDPYGFLNTIHDFLGIPQITKPASRMRRSSRSLKSMLDEILAILPVDELKALYNEKLETSADFAELINRLSSDEFHQLVLRVLELDAVQELIQMLRDAGIDVDAIMDFIRNLFGWADSGSLKLKKLGDVKMIQRFPPKKSSRNLQDDLNDFLALIPVDEIVNIVLTYVANDAEVQAALQYLMSDEFESIVVYVDQQPELYDLLNFLESSGLDPYGFLNMIHDFLGIPQITKPASRMRRSSRSLKSMLDEILAILPVDELKALYNEKLETSADFAELINRLSSDEFHQLVLRVLELDAVQELIQMLRDAGIDVDAIMDFIRNLFGWADSGSLKLKPFHGARMIQRFPPKKSSRNLQDDLNDFLALIPVDEIVNIVLNYVANDAEVQAALQYLMSDEFESIVVYVDQQPELYDLLNFLESSGLDPYGFLNTIHDFLGIPQITKPASRMRRSSRSLKSMLDEILAILPVDELKALYNEKLETSADFAELINRLSSDEFHQLVLRVLELDAVQELIQMLRDAGIDVDAIMDFIRNLFGWADSGSLKLKPIRGAKMIQRFPAKKSSRNLQDDLNDFLALIPVDEIVNIVLNYVANDAEVQAALQYLMSDEFESIVVYVDQQPELYDLLNFLESSGLDPYGFLNTIHDFLGIPQITKPASRMRRSSRSLKSMLDEILAILPVDELKALYNEKLETSADFAELINRLSSDEFHQLVLRVLELDAVQELIQMLRDAGIDVDAIMDFIRNLFGWAYSQPALLQQQQQQQQQQLRHSCHPASNQLGGIALQSPVGKMRSFLLFAAVVGLACGAAVPKGLHQEKHHRFSASRSSRNLQDDLNDFLALIPVDEIVNIVLTYVANDAEVQAALQYLMSDEFESIVVYIDQQPELYDLLNFLEDSGLDPYGFLNMIHDFLGIPQITKPASRMRRSSRSLKSMLDEILAILPVDELKALYNEKLETSPDFAELINRLSSDEFHQLVLRVGELEAVQNMIQMLRDAGIDVDAIADFFRRIFGWASKETPSTTFKMIQRFPAKKSSRNLQDDLNDFLALIPVDEIVNIVLTYVANDAEVQAALQYLMSDEFESIVVYIDQQPELYDLLNFLEDSGLDPYGFLNMIHDFLGIPQITKPASRMRRSSRSLKSMLDEILAILPVDELKALYNEKLETSPDFAELINRLSSDEFHQLVLRVGELEAVQNMIQMLRDAGIDVDAIADFFRRIFGWASKETPFTAFKMIQRFPAKKSSRNLQDDLNDFLALIPVDEIVNIVLTYVANDAEVQAALQYLMSDEFESIVVYIDQQPELYDLLNFLEDSGLDPYGFLNMIHDFLGIPQITKPASRMRRSSRSLKSMLDEILAILPVDELKALYNEKLETSPDFAELINRLSSDEFHQLVLRVGELEAVQNMIQMLRDAGIDVDAIADFFRKIFVRSTVGKMRFFLLFAAVVGLACGAAVHRGPKSEKFQRFPTSKSSRNLQDDLNDFLALIPVDEIVNIVLNYVANDAEVQAALQYLMSDEFESIVVYVDQQPELYDLLNFLESSGLDPYGFLNTIHDFLGIPQITKPASRMRRSSRSLKSMLDEILAILPVDELKALYNEKLETSADFAELINRLSSDEFHQLVLRVLELDAVQELIQMLRDAGIDVDAIMDFIRNLFGWADSGSLKLKPFHGARMIQRFPAKKSSRNLQDDLNDFLALIPVDEIVNIVLNYVANDAEVQAALQYLMSDEFESIVVYVDQQPELYDLLNFLESSGLDPYGFLNMIHDFLGIPQITKPASRMRRSSRSLKSMLDEILAILPVDELKALYNEKLETSADFAELINRLSSDEFHQLVLRVLELDAVQELIQMLRDAGIDVDAIMDFIRNLFGWADSSSLKLRPYVIVKKIQRFPAKKSSRNLQDDLNDFLALIPVDEIVNIVLNYVANDAEVQAALQYLMSDEFESIVVYVDQQPELYDLLNFLESSGLDPYGFLNMIHDFLGIPQITKPASRMRRSSRSLKSMLDEILAILPVDELKALYNEKLETSPDFAELINRLSSDEFHQLVLRVLELDAVQELIQMLRDAGIDVDAIMDFIRNLFGWADSSSLKLRPIIAVKKIQRFPAKKSSRNLQDDLNDFLALIPVDEIVNIVLNYVANDAEVQAALQYLMSDEFESIVVYVDQQPELYDLLNFLESSGLDPYGFLNMIHDFLGIPQITKPASRMRRSSRSLKSMLDEILAILPVDELKALYNEKLETSADFAELINRLSSDEFHQLVLRVLELDAVQDLIQMLRDAGIDVDAIMDFFRKIFGWTF
ncbi:uncharacterized protein LOC124795576 [Schistocerca piceifrons]|uniref:uncharacterized protein LOC124795576 n=1 Tax=Schistocerca piceifrons TaxID=274613 RepID=UPI001F5F487A|nr:uncharacterized protein LOC124795576 [Schistocerca piceifrons]